MGHSTTVERYAALLMDAGARAVVLMGSVARGEDHRHSDLDFLALGDGPSRMAACEGRLISEQWLTEDRARANLYDPSKAGCDVPGWRTAAILHDPDGVAASLRREALVWTWQLLGDAPDRVVAEQVVGNCEEVHRLVGNLLLERRMAAAFVRSVLALHCAGIMAIHRRLLYATENQLWSDVAEIMGAEWKSAQEAAFGFRGEDVGASALAALRLFELTAATANTVLDAGQREVVDLARAAIDELRSARG